MSTRSRDYQVLIVTLLLFFACAEIVTRLVVPAPLPWKWPQTRYERSSLLGFRLKPEQVAYTADKSFRTNAMGLRGPARSWNKPTRARRILILGDSIAAGYGVTYEDSFAQKLENLLNDSEGRKTYEVIDTAVPEYNTIQEVTYFREEGVRFEPDAVILAVCWNDISSKLDVTADDNGELVDDKVAVDISWYTRWALTERGYRMRNLLKRSRFLYFVVDRMRNLRARFEGPIQELTAMQLAVLTGQDHPAVIAGWADIDGQFATLADLCRSRGIKLLVAILPMSQLLEPGKYPHAQYPEHIQRMCEKYGLNCVDILPAFVRQFTGRTPLFIPYDGDHPNEKGHLIIAESLRMALRQAGV